MEVTIYQAKDDCKYIFRGYDKAVQNGFDLKDYNEVYHYFIFTMPNKANNYSVIMTEDETIKILEKIFEKFNWDCPEDFKGRSLSSSDVVALDDELYYCDNFGWRKIC